jgi:hypothetical protein
MARGGAIRVTIQALKRRFDELLIQLDELEGTTFKPAFAR